jgi:hypothetical protein
MRREEHMVGDTFAYRFTDPSADHVLLVQHGIGGHGGIYDKFGAHYAGLARCRGVVHGCPRPWSVMR